MDALANRLLGMVCNTAVAEALGRVSAFDDREVARLLLPLTLPVELARPQLDEHWRDRPPVAWGGQTDHVLLGVDAWAALGARTRHWLPHYLERLTLARVRPPSSLIPRLADELQIADNIRLRQLDLPGRGADGANDHVLLAAARAAEQTGNYRDALFARELADKYWRKTRECTAGALPRAVAVALAPVALAEKIPLVHEATRCTHADPLCVAAGVALTTLLHRVIFDGEGPALAARAGLEAGRSILTDEESLGVWDSFMRRPERIQLAEVNDAQDDAHVLRALCVVAWAAFALEAAAEAFRGAQGLPEGAPLALPDAGKELLERVVLEGGDVGAAAPLVGALVGAALGYDGMPLDWLAALQGRHALELCARRAISRLGLKAAVQPRPVKVRVFRFRPASCVRTAYELDGELWFHNRPCGSRKELEKWAAEHYRGVRRGGGFRF